VKPDVAAQLRALALRVPSNLPRHNHPERFHVEKDDIAKGILALAALIEADAPKAALVSQKRRARVTSNTVVRWRNDPSRRA
jgi:hypothetical protein